MRPHLRSPIGKRLRRICGGQTFSDKGGVPRGFCQSCIGMIAYLPADRFAAVLVNDRAEIPEPVRLASRQFGEVPIPQLIGAVQERSVGRLAAVAAH
ncbi:hypothetical protein A2625_01940 [candidate division WOR-1 bacterium RIFCSPHIGHO2_01_FULL_53_15]|uniref:Uncharacterized protein n=1 Tax=candidate division WOR-1 bacterium RIFCSPHIGHO2_01_FULL_53_15 TaxID=1802564 RepID=A0A1F4Q2H3_UNCSA|nr:MAG: hypothetical protein A2625_01940 [candidate division WOR-1 bacterium RIFCSPHIGHO2_01_FULL_53_15]OGC13590.1 MAG: hypothetical protein A3D23_06065 [candidate division WOR-1 bacterium RIFCSPHIGHO2_02_FULL_53_26]